MTRSRGFRRAIASAGARTLAVAAIAGLGASCSLPVSIPLGPMAAIGQPDGATGSVPGTTETAETIEAAEPVDEEGIVERVGALAWAALSNALVSAAEQGEDGQPFSWKADNAGVEGTVTAINAFFDENGVVCRRMAITANAFQRTESFATEACRKDNGSWAVRPADRVR